MTTRRNFIKILIMKVGTVPTFINKVGTVPTFTGVNYAKQTKFY